MNFEYGWIQSDKFGKTNILLAHFDALDVNDYLFYMN